MEKKMNPVIKNMMDRRTIRKYTDEPVSDETMNELKKKNQIMRGIKKSNYEGHKNVGKWRNISKNLLVHPEKSLYAHPQMAPSLQTPSLATNKKIMHALNLLWTLYYFRFNFHNRKFLYILTVLYTFVFCIHFCKLGRKEAYNFRTANDFKQSIINIHIT